MQERLQEELAGLRDELGEDAFNASRFELAAELFENIISDRGELAELLTLPAYGHIQ